MTEEILSSIEFQMSLLLFVALAGYLVASRINQSAVVGEILVGILVGPSVLGWITYTDFVASIAHLGAIFLLFTIGFEFSIRDIANLRYGVIAIVGVVVPWIGGYLDDDRSGVSDGCGPLRRHGPDGHEHRDHRERPQGARPARDAGRERRSSARR